MKLLFITQKVDRNDTVLGAIHGWIEEFSKKVESITVICLYKGDYDLPANVKVLSLGKELRKDGEKSRIKYIKNFYKYIWQERKNYDNVFVHMNQEYILLGGWLWKILGLSGRQPRKKIYMWRNHHAGSWLTDIAAAFCTHVFCPSKFSYTAKYKKTIFMPVGVDSEIFKPDSMSAKIPNSILFLARISPTKRPDLFIETIIKVKDKFPGVIADIYGNPASKDLTYYEDLKEKVESAGAGNYISFHSGIPNAATVAVYNTHEIFVNLSSSGMYDKTILEAMACGSLVIASNENLRGHIGDDFIFTQGNGEELLDKLEKILRYTIEEKEKAGAELRKFAESHSLKTLSEKLFEIIK